jgi:lipopolysaccharide export LptBFGC system permease protein LptF
VKAFALMFGLMCVQYALVAINTRKVAQGSYFGTAWSDALLAIFGFTLIQHVAQSDALSARVGYVLGGVCGGCAGVWLSRERG